MTQHLTIIQTENIQTIVQAAPQAFQDNKLSQQRCDEAGQAIYNAIKTQGMTDALDQQAAVYIEKARKTVKKMNERRAPVTKLFDDIRKEFTAMENSIDPLKPGTVPYVLQQQRNQFAARKHAEEERKRRLELERQQAEAVRATLLQDIEDDFRNQFSAYIAKACNALTAIDAAVTLDNYEASYKTVKNYCCTLPADFITGLQTAFINIPVGISVSELNKAEETVKSKLAEQFHAQFAFELESTRDYILDRLPSKKANLQRIAQADAEEKARIKAEMEARRLKDEAEREAERRRKEAEQRKQAEVARQQAEMDTIFSQQATLQDYQPKTKVSKKIELLSPEGILPVFSMWWSKEGCKMSVEDIAKMFKKQITFCERLANKDEVFIKDANLNYIDDVKAK